MTYLLFVQSEGRGHLSQALAVASGLRARGHKICGVVANRLPQRTLPDYFIQEIEAPIHFIDSPYFLTNKKQTGISFYRSIGFNLMRGFTYRRSLLDIKKIITENKPDVLLNFYEPLCGLYQLLFKRRVPCITFGHQFFFDHPDYQRPEKHYFDYLSLKFYNFLTSYGSCARLALSFSDSADYLKKRIFVCPPLIRKSILESTPVNQNFLLSYTLNPGYAEMIIDWVQKNPNIKIEAFWDKKDAKEQEKPFPNLCFHRLSGDLFINRLSNCQAYISTGGFESICEAAYLQKPILMVPTTNHYEQLCNSYDAKRAGLADFSLDFDLDKLLALTKDRTPESGLKFKDWVDNNQDKIFNLLVNPPYQT